MEFIKHSIKKHPYLSIFYLWLYLFCSFGRFIAKGFCLFSAAAAVLLVLILIPADLLYLKKTVGTGSDKKRLLRDIVPVALTAVWGGAAASFYAVLPANKLGWGRNAAVILAAGLLFLGAAVLKERKKLMLSEYRLSVLVFLTAVLLHFFFNVYSEFNIQMDLRFFNSGELPDGHVGYMRYLYEHFLPLQSDPRPYWQFYHPPLHHYLEAALLRVQTFFGADLEVVIYNIKYLPLLYFMLMCITVKRLAGIIGVKGRAQLFTSAIVWFSPGFVFISNYANNDMLSIFLMVQSIYLAALWYRDRRLLRIIYVAVCFGAAMFTKLSSWMAAVPIAVIFIAALLSQLRKKQYSGFGRLLGQMTVFMLIAAPISFYWSLRNMLRFGVPIGYIPVSDSEYQFISAPVMQRLFDFSPYQIMTPYINNLRISDYCEYNPLIAMLKTSSADLYIGDNFGAPFDMLNLIALWVTVALAAAAFGCMIRVIVKKGGMPVFAKIAMLCFYCVLLVSYYVFCIKYPHVCTEDIRYASPLIIIGGYCVGLVMSGSAGTQDKVRNVIKKGLSVLISGFCVLSFLVFAADGLWTCLYFNML